jgi:hypothetical protein
VTVAEALLREIRVVELFGDPKKPHHGNLTWRGPLSAEMKPTRSVRGRINTIMPIATEKELFNAACSFREMIAEGKLAPRVALHFLVTGCRELWREDADRCRLTIANGFRHVEQKLATANAANGR